jgi:hypothetical protein
MPRSFATLAVADRLPTGHMHRDKCPDTCANMSPALPVTTANVSPDHCSKLVEQFQLRCQAEVAHLAEDITQRNAQAVVHRNPTAAPGDFADPMLEPPQRLRRHLNRSARVPFTSLRGSQRRECQAYAQRREVRNEASVRATRVGRILQCNQIGFRALVRSKTPNTRPDPVEAHRANPFAPDTARDPITKRSAEAAKRSVVAFKSIAAAR